MDGPHNDIIVEDLNEAAEGGELDFPEGGLEAESGAPRLNLSIWHIKHKDNMERIKNLHQ